MSIIYDVLDQCVRDNSSKQWLPRVNVVWLISRPIYILACSWKWAGSFPLQTLTSTCLNIKGNNSYLKIFYICFLLNWNEITEVKSLNCLSIRYLTFYSYLHRHGIIVHHGSLVASTAHVQVHALQSEVHCASMEYVKNSREKHRLIFERKRISQMIIGQWTLGLELKRQGVVFHVNFEIAQKVFLLRARIASVKWYSTSALEHNFVIRKLSSSFRIEMHILFTSVHIV